MAWLISCVLDMDMTLIFDDFESELWVLCLCRLSKWWSKEGRGCWLLILDIKAWTVALTYLPSVRKAARFTAASTSHHRRSSSVRWAVNSKPICLAEVKLYCVNWWHRDTAVAWVCAAADSWDRASVQLPPCPAWRHVSTALWAMKVVFPKLTTLLCTKKFYYECLPTTNSTPFWCKNHFCS